MVVHKGWWPKYTSGITKLVYVEIQTNSEYDLIFFSSGKTSVIGGLPSRRKPAPTSVSAMSGTLKTAAMSTPILQGSFWDTKIS